MKKPVFLALLGLFAFSVQVCSQSGGSLSSKPVMGYDKVSWGASVDEVRAAYDIGQSTALEENYNGDRNIASLLQDSVSDAIVSREFLFNKYDSGEYRLYRVWISYRDLSNTNKENLLKAIESRYGKRTDYDYHRGTEQYLFFLTLGYSEETSTFGKYSPDLEVELKQRIYSADYEKDTMNLIGKNYLDVVYTWKKFRDDYNASRLGL